MVEIEVKCQIHNILDLVKLLNRYCVFRSNAYIKDVMYVSKKSSKKEKPRIRFRSISSFQHITSFEVALKKRIKPKGRIKTEIEEILYEGYDLKEALRSIGAAGDFYEESVYEKNRATFDFKIIQARAHIDLYPFGAWLKIEAEPEIIWHAVKLLGFKKADAVAVNADELYSEWIQKHGVRQQTKVQFGVI